MRILIAVRLLIAGAAPAVAADPLASPFLAEQTDEMACLAAFSLRASAIIFYIRMGPPGEFVRLGKTEDDPLGQR